MNADEKAVTDPTDAEWTAITEATPIWERVERELKRYGARVAREAYALGRLRGTTEKESA
jgi:hypothetical protein